MKLNNIEFGYDFQVMMSHALVLARETGKPYGIDFKGIDTDNINLSLEKGKLAHLWIHTQHEGQLFRCAITETDCGLFVWTDGRGWIAYGSSQSAADKLAAIKETIKSLGYKFNRYWTINLPSGNYINNSKLGGWNGLELWCKGQDGHAALLRKQGSAYLDGILAELKSL